MNPCLSAPIRAGSAAGVVFWQVETCSFGARLQLDGFDRDRHPRDAGGGLVFGGRAGEFATIDGLVNQLRLRGLAPDRRSNEAIAELRDRATRTFGDAELIGLDGPDGGAVLLALPDGSTTPLQPTVDHPDHGFGWGPGRAVATDHSVMETARTLVRCAWSAGWGTGEEMFAQALVHNFLGDCGAEFSVNANSLCDWYLFDRDLTTGLTAAALRRLISTEVRAG